MRQAEVIKLSDIWSFTCLSAWLQNSEVTCLCEDVPMPPAAEPPVTHHRCTGEEENCQRSQRRSFQTLLSLEVAHVQIFFCLPRTVGKSFRFNPSIWCPFDHRIKVHSCSARRFWSSWSKSFRPNSSGKSPYPGSPATVPEPFGRGLFFLPYNTQGKPSGS